MKSVCIKHSRLPRFSIDLLPVTETDWTDKSQLIKNYLKIKPTTKTYIFI